MVAHQAAAELKRVGAGGARHFVHETFQVHAVLVGVDAAPGPDRNGRVAHRVFDEQVRHAVAELRVARLLVQALYLPHVAAVPDDGRIEIRVDRLARNADVHAGELAALVDAGGEFALRDRPEVVVLHVLFAAPDQLYRDAGKLLGDGNGLAR